MMYFSDMIHKDRWIPARLLVILVIPSISITFIDVVSMDLVSLLCFSVDVQVPEISSGKKWETPLLVRNSVKSGRVFITQFEHNANNFVSLVV